MILKKYRFSLHTSRVAYQAKAYPEFCGVKQLGVFLPPSNIKFAVPIYTPGWREALWELRFCLFRTQCNVSSQGLDPDSSIWRQAH